MTKRFNIALGLGVILLSLFFSTTTASAGLLEPTPPGCAAPCTVTHRFNPDPGVTYNLEWQGLGVDGVRTTCSGDASQPGCFQTVTYDQPGRYEVRAVYGPGQYDYGNDTVTVYSQSDVIEPMQIYGKQRLVSPRDQLTVVTPLPSLGVTWRSSKKVRDGIYRVPLVGEGYVRKVGTRDGKNVFKVRIYAPRGRLYLNFYADDNEGRQDTRDGVKRYVTAYRGPERKVDRFRIPRSELIPQGLRLAVELDIMAIKAAYYEITVKVYKGRRVVFARQFRGHTVATAQVYGFDPYGDLLRVPMGRLKGVGCGSRLKVRADAKVWTGLNGRRIYHRRKSAPVVSKC